MFTVNLKFFDRANSINGDCPAGTASLVFSEFHEFCMSRCGCIGSYNCKGVYPVSFIDSLLVALFMMTIVFVALFALYLFVRVFSLLVETAEHAAKHKKAAL